MLKKLIIPALALIITTSVIYFTARAGVLNPTLAPADTGVTLEDIYCKITGCTASTSYALERAGSATGTMFTLAEIYNVQRRVMTAGAGTLKPSERTPPPRSP